MSEFTKVRDEVEADLKGLFTNAEAKLAALFKNLISGLSATFEDLGKDAVAFLEQDAKTIVPEIVAALAAGTSLSDALKAVEGSVITLANSQGVDLGEDALQGIMAYLGNQATTAAAATAQSPTPTPETAGG